MLSLTPAAARAVVLTIAAAFAMGMAAWVAIDTHPTSWDQSAHARFALQYLRFFGQPVAKWNSLVFLTVSVYWPPLFYLSSVPATAVFGYSIDAVALTNLLFLLLLVWSLWKIGARLFDRTAAAGAVAATLLCPLVFALSRDILLDFALLATVAFAQYAILASDGGLERRRSWLMGLAVGAALLVKWTALPFLLPTWLIVVVPAWLKRTGPERRRGLLGLGLAFIVAAAVAGPWYYTAASRFGETARIALKRDPVLEGDPRALGASLLWYWIAFRDAIVSPLLLPFFGAGVAAAAVFARKTRAWIFLLGWIVPAILVFAAVPNKDPRFILPLLPGLALLAAAGLSAVPWKPAAAAAWISFLVAGTLQFTAMSFAWPRAAGHPYTHPAARAEWAAARILDDLEGIRPGQALPVAVLAEEPFFNPNIFILDACLRHPRFRVDGIGHEPLGPDDLGLYGVFITKTGSIAVEHVAAHRRAFQREFETRGAAAYGFEPFKEYPLPDGSIALVYVRAQAVPKAAAKSGP